MQVRGNFKSKYKQVEEGTFHHKLKKGCMELEERAWEGILQPATQHSSPTTCNSRLNCPQQSTQTGNWVWILQFNNILSLFTLGATYTEV